MVFNKKSGFEKFRKIYRKTPVLESLFNKGAGIQACNFIKKRFQQECFPVNIAKFSTVELRGVFKKQTNNVHGDFLQINLTVKSR